MNDPLQSETNYYQFSIRKLLITIAIIGGWTGILIQPNLREALFGSIEFLTNYVSPLLIGFLLTFTCPVFLVLMIIYLALFPPRPVSAWLFLGCLVILLSAGYTSDLYRKEIIECVSLTWIGITILMGFEIYQRGLRKHIVTVACAAYLSLAYWFLAYVDLCGV